MSIFKNSIKVAGIAILVPIIGGIIQAITNFHSGNMVANFFMTVFGGVIIGGLNAFMHKIQGTTIVPTNTVELSPNQGAKS